MGRILGLDIVELEHKLGSRILVNFRLKNPALAIFMFFIYIQQLTGGGDSRDLKGGIKKDL